MSILIIGGTGFIGLRLARYMVNQGEKVTCFDLMPQLPGDLAGKVQVASGDVSRMEDIIAAIKENNITRIVNLAYILAPDSETKLNLGMRVNVLGMNNVFEAARIMAVSRVVFSSSIVVYGPQSNFGPKAVSEDDQCFPQLVYSTQKLWNEFMAKQYITRHGLHIAGIRLSAVAGPGRSNGITGYLGRYIDDTIQGKSVEIPFASDQRIIVSYVDDIAEILGRVCLAETLNHSIYNSGGYQVTLAELVAEVEKIIPQAEFKFKENVYDYDMIQHWTSQRIEQELNYKLPPLKTMINRHMNEVSQDC